MQLARTVAAVLGVAASIVTTGLISVVPASAHTSTVWAKCVDEKAVLHVDLKAYNMKRGLNEVTVSLDGAELESARFGTEFTKQYDGGDAAEPHSFKIVVKAADNDKFSFTKGEGGELDVPACVEKKVVTTTAAPTTTPATTAAGTTTPPAPPVETTTPVAAAAPVTTTSVAVAAASAEGGLANTGASIAIPLVIGLVLLGGGVALLIVLRRRARA
ncbi:hypothetical protein [Actinosynnema sp. NPDC023587]|uniref:hypothetical protein n=1 Tax=Actinosynnema sp. NPDC023587 TaxID=3154695 RepID=UPI0033DE41B9